MEAKQHDKRALPSNWTRKNIATTLVDLLGDEVSDFDASHRNQVRFKWKGMVIGLDTNGGAFEVEGNFLYMSEAAMLLRSLCKEALQNPK